MKIKSLDRDFVESEFGYRLFTTFFEDFSIAEAFGVSAVRGTYKRAFNEWKSDYKYLTELVLILNWKIWEHYKEDKKYAEVYNELFNEANNYARDNLEGDELLYFFNVTD